MSSSMSSISHLLPTNVRSTRLLPIAILLFLLILFLPSLLPKRVGLLPSTPSHKVTVSSGGTLTDESQGWLGKSVSLQDVLEMGRRRVEAKVKEYDAVGTKKQLGIDIPKHLSMEEYTEQLKEIWQKWFIAPSSSAFSRHTAPSSPTDDLLKHTLSHLSLVPPELLPSSQASIPRYIYTTDLKTPKELPDQFTSWITENREWTTMFVRDGDIDGWLEQAVGVAPGSRLGQSLEQQDSGEGEEPDRKRKRTVGVPRVVEEMEWLKADWGVVRADMFRYLILLINGGVYTDTDTASVLPLERWGISHKTYPPDPLLSSLPHLVSLISSSSSSSPPPPPEDETEPNLIVAIEVDALATNANWQKQSFVRGLQVVQWTIVGKRGHPVFLDVIGHALGWGEKVRAEEQRGKRDGEAESEKKDGEILEWSGPGAFTDAVFRYLLVRYGFHPDEASGLKQPLRVGDVVLMPVNSFRADASEGFQGDHKVVWHGFFGRWKKESS
ncbi:hypothetical protein B9479_000283 [Cryptococcus floricola]|uniref:Alpha-1,6-mannosyltransferase n=1 Tax=Cryptococcus floricola TaxID=2591691 RepID=A0A5D3B8B4_9TREE|nr:hypothetical protein B9479_000283 [Cryptococcus floricola]